MSQVKSGPQQQADNELVLSFLSVRRAIGLLGYFLPLVLIVYGLWSPDGILGSISAYYYTPMREVFVGTLCAQAVFLWSYEGYRDPDPALITDRNIARLAAIGVLLVALMPTAEANAYKAAEAAPVTMDRPVDCTLAQCLLGDQTASMIHNLGAFLFFGALAVFCLVLFVKGGTETPEKRARQRIYRICGWIIIAAMALMAVVSLGGLTERLAHLRPIFWLEVAASFAFATSWLVKGDSLHPLVQMAVRAGST